MQPQVVDRLRELEERFEALSAEMVRPEIVQDNSRYTVLVRQRAELEDIVEAYRKLQQVERGIADSTGLLREADVEMRELAEAEIESLEAEQQGLEADLLRMLLPKDPNDEKNVVLEIRAGTGGDEAGLFASDLFRMYARYAERKGWRLEILSQSEGSVGGLKEVIASIEGKNVYSRLKCESGVHRVQRVPDTEASGRIHTSTATVVVLPEAEEVDVHIDPKDLRIDTFCSSGPGGQSVNTTYSAVRITHIPTGLVVSQQDEKSQIKNRQKAMKVLRSRLYEMELRKQQEAIAKERKGQVGSGDRSEKIRTYNFKENRITDHRINFTIYQLQAALEGDLDTLFKELVTHEQAAQLKAATEGAPAGD